MTASSLGRILRPLVAILLTGYILWQADPSAVLRAAGDADWRWLAASAALVIVDRSLMAYRWITLLSPVDSGSRPPVTELLHIFFVSTFLGTFLPASVGGDLVRAYSLARLQVARGQALASVLMDRMLGVMSIVIVAVIGIVAAGRRDLVSVQGVYLSLIVATGLCAAIMAVVFSERAAELARRLGEAVPVRKVAALAAEVTGATRAYATHHLQLVNVLAGSVAVQLLRIAQAYCLGLALGMTASASAYLAFIPMILLVMLLPVTINGIGTSQVAFVWFFARAGTPAPEAFALSVLFLGLGVLGNLPGGLLYAIRPHPRAVQP
ncbi:MAG: YbhN family protein [Vicinamibacterales bacterium]